MALEPKRGELLAVAHYDSGNVSLLSLDSFGRLSQSDWQMPKLRPLSPTPTSNLIHDVAFDAGCDDEPQLLLVDAGRYQLATTTSLDATLGVPPAKFYRTVVNAGTRPRHAVLHPEAEVLYVVHEWDGSVGVWPWTKGGKWGAPPGCSQLGTELLAAAKTLPKTESCDRSGVNTTSKDTAWDGTCSNIEAGASINRTLPTEIVISEDGRFVYVANPLGNTGEGKVSVFRTAGPSYLELVQAFPVPKIGARLLELSAGGEFLMVGSANAGVASLRLSRSSGLILGVAGMVETIDSPASLAVFAA